MLRAVIADELGPPSNYRLARHDPGAPGSGQVRIAIRAAGVSFVDVLTAAGKYQVKPPLPFIPGSECAGVVEVLGEGVTGLRVGQAVVASNWGGLFADAAVVAARSVRPAPTGLSFAEAALFPVSAYTARHALVERGKLQAGETLLVLGAGGATGLAAVQLGHYLGARVIASASSEDKRALALVNGADAAIDARAENWRELVREANAKNGVGKPVDVVFDPVGGAVTEPAFRSLGWNGRHLVVGFTGGIASFRTNLALLKGASLIGVDLRQYGVNEPQAAEANMRESFKLAEVGAIRPVIARSYPLDRFAEAMTEAEAGRTAGRIVLEMTQ
jgi:NADPH2:quinone reductase